MPPLSLESTAVGAGRAMLRVAGEIDVYTAPDLRERIVQLVDDGVVHLLVDLRAVTFLDSTGLGALVGSLRRLRARDGSLTLVSDTDRILKLFRVTGLDRVFVLRPSVQAVADADPDWQAAATALDA
jgi:anti-sigma B factor antagonist